MRLATHLPLIGLLAVLAGPADAAPRTWTSADGQRKIHAELVKHDAASVTVRMPNGKLVTMELALLSDADQKWLKDLNAPPPAAVAKPGMFDTLAFGDTREQVLAKLKASKLVELTMAEQMLGRTGLNDVFRTRVPAAGMHFTLFFGWDDAGKLEELSLHSVPVAASEYPTTIAKCFAEHVTLLTKANGAPLQEVPFPAVETLEDGGVLFTHLWRLPGDATLLLGTARDSNKFSCLIRFTRQKIEPVTTPAN
jgi:hypothetical protein